MGQSQCSEAGQELAELTADLEAAKKTVDTLFQAAVERDKEILLLRQELAKQRDEQVLQHRIALAERDRWLVELEVDIKGREQHLNNILKSPFWRITYPLRFLAHQVKRAVYVSNLIQPAINLGGGLAPVVHKAIHVISSEGINGLKQKIGAVAASRQSKMAEPETVIQDPKNYTEWVKRYDTLTNSMREQLRNHVGVMPTTPLISIIMPTYNTKAVWLEAAIDSVLDQIYPHWELCIADDASTDPQVKAILEKYARSDSRIKLCFRSANGHISAASNSALELATGEWIALFDHDDLLSEEALFWVADTINRQPDVHLIYSDEDKVDEAGQRRFAPYFKCDWNVDLFYAQNLFSHLGVFRSQLVRTVGGFRAGFEGSQDYDLVLRCIERVRSSQISHIPRVLYHWRTHEDSTAKAGGVKPYAVQAAQRALTEHLTRVGRKASVEIVKNNLLRVRYELPEELPLVSIIVPTRNQLFLTKQCISSILEKTTYSNYEIIVVDNGSDDPAALYYFDLLKANNIAKVIRDDRPFNYSALNNLAVAHSNGEVLALLNNDVEVIAPEWLSEMISLATQRGVGAVGAKLLYPDDTVQHAGVILGIGGVGNHAHKHFPRYHHGFFGRAMAVQSFSAVTGACLVVRTAFYKEVGQLNEADLAVAFNDVDLCLKLREAGYKNLWTPYAELYHHESVSRGQDSSPEKKARFAKETEYMKKRWADSLKDDPAYSPNLTLKHPDFAYAWPPRITRMPAPYLNLTGKRVFDVTGA